MRQYKLQEQSMILIVRAVVHNFIRMHVVEDELFSVVSNENQDVWLMDNSEDVARSLSREENRDDNEMCQFRDTLEE